MPIDEKHSVINPPKTNVSLWRYMDIPSFLSLLTSESLTFVRADLFEDKYEGKLPKMTAKLIDEGFNKLIKQGKLNSQNISYSELLNKGNHTTYLNCWCKENHEMVHMWKIYSKENGIAIETNYEILKDSIETNEIIYPTEINYIDFNNDIIDWKSNAMTVYTIKRKEYKSENEFRLILPFPRDIQNQITNDKSINKNNLKNLYLETPAIKCRVDIHKLITKIHISPYSPKWHYNVISDILIKYKLEKKEIIQSEL